MKSSKKYKTWVLPKSGSVDVFKLESRETPAPGAGEIGVQVAFSGLNFADILMRQGLYPDAPAYPFVPGYEVSGFIDSLGEGVEGLTVGQRVCAGTAFGGYGSRVVIPSWQAMSVSDDISLDEAAGIPVSALTAYNILFELGRVKKGERVLIDCASGALGQMIHSMLSNSGVELFGLTSSEHKKQWLLERGVSAWTHKDFKNSALKDFDLILNSLGGTSVKDDYQRLAPLGRLICVGASQAISPGRRNLFKALKTVLSFPRFKVVQLMNDNKAVMGLNVLRLLERPDVLKTQLAEIQKMKLRSSIDRIFSHRHLHLAQTYLEQRQSRGKVLLDWRDEVS